MAHELSKEAAAKARKNGKKGGRPKGKKTAKTLQKEAVLKEYRDKAMAVVPVLFNAQMSLARGLSYLFKIEKKKITGPKGGVSYIPQRPKLVTNEFEIEEYLAGRLDESDEDDNDPAATYYYITAKDPSSQTIDSIMDRTFGKNAQSLDLTSGGKAFGVSEEAEAVAATALGNFLNGKSKKSK